MLDINGSYRAEFRSKAGLFGSGTVNLNEGVISGGDNDYSYAGKYIVEKDGTIKGLVDVINHGNNLNIFNFVGDIKLSLTGRLLEVGSMRFEGSVLFPDRYSSLQMVVILTKIN